MKGVTRVLKAHETVVRKGTKHVGSETIADQCEMITIPMAANALGSVLTPLYILLRKLFGDQFIRDRPTGCSGKGNKSGR